MFSFGGKKKTEGEIPNNVKVDWKKSEQGNYMRLLHIRVGRDVREGEGGVYVIWHMGMKPGWVFVGKSNNLADTLEEAKDDKELTYYEKSGGLFVTWAPFKPQFRDGIVNYLREALAPAVTACDVDLPINEAAPPIRVNAPVNIR